MTALVLTITNAGMDRFTAAQGADDIDLTVARVGVTAQAFAQNPALTTLPGESKRLGTVSGQALPHGIVHLTIRDLSADTYTVRGLGLYLADGTLFAFGGQTNILVEKSANSTLLLAIDMKFPSDDVSAIQFGDANFDYPPATEESLGVAELATQAEVAAGTDGNRIVTPKTLAERLRAIVELAEGAVRRTGDRMTGNLDMSNRRIEALGTPLNTLDAAHKGYVDAATDARLLRTGDRMSGGLDMDNHRIEALGTPLNTLDAAHKGYVDAAAEMRVPRGRVIATTGLATGGGDLTGDRTINVPRAAGVDVFAGTEDGRAVTPKALRDACASWGDVSNGGRRTADGTIEQWGHGGAAADGSFTVVFPLAFPNECNGALATNDANGPPSAFTGIGARSLTGMKVWQAVSATNPAPGAAAFWRAWGR